MRKLMTLISLISVSYSGIGQSCTTLLLEGCQDQYLGKSYDWDQSHGYVLINPRNLAKQSLTLKKSDSPAKWTAKYGSLTFNQYGRDFPLGGINEKGLGVEVMWLSSSVYPGPDPRPTLNELQWIQYQLDNFATAAEVVKHADTLRVSPVLAKVHYMVCDTQKDCATVEYVNGELTIHRNLSVPVLTNNTYAESFAHLKKHQGFGGSLPLPKGQASLSRFVRAAESVANYSICSLPQYAVEYALDSLENVAVTHTQFNIVYELSQKVLHFRTALAPEIKSITLDSFDFSCSDPDNIQWFDINSSLKGDVTGEFAPLTMNRNLKLVKQGFSKYINQVPKELIPLTAKFPWSYHCIEKKAE